MLTLKFPNLRYCIRSHYFPEHAKGPLLAVITLSLSGVAMTSSASFETTVISNVSLRSGSGAPLPEVSAEHFVMVLKTGGAREFFSIEEVSGSAGEDLEYEL